LKALPESQKMIWKKIQKNTTVPVKQIGSTTYNTFFSSEFYASLQNQ